MAISVTPTYLGQRTDLSGVYLRQAKLAISGLASGANTVPHGLPATPRKVEIEPTSAGGFHETQAADATNIYLTADGSGATCNVYVEY